MRESSWKKRAVSIVSCLMVGCFSPAFAQTPPPPTQSGFIYNGITHISFWFDEYNNFGAPTGQGTDSRTELAATHASWAGVLVTQYQDNAAATIIAPRFTDKTPTDDAVTIAISELHAKGIKVMLKPHVDSNDGAWRGTFQPTDVDAWFASFTKFIVHYAQLAQVQNVELLCFGTEYVQLSGAANQARWNAVIAAIRNVYTGKITYAANATFPGDEFTTVSFWDKVDVLGIDGYFPLTNHANPTLPELVAAWRNNEFNEDLVATVQNFSDAHQKPLIFTEVGYKSVAGANTQPFNFTFPGAFDLTEQANCYTAFYNTWSSQNSWMLGVFWWAWPVPPPAANDTDYNPRGKPAEDILKSFQGPPTSVAGFHLAANPVSIGVVQGASAGATVAVNASGGFVSPVMLSVSGLPAGITATLNPAIVTGASGSITFSVASTVPVGTAATATITGTGGGITSATTIKLAVITPDFALAASPSQINVHQGGAGTSTINIARIGGFSGSVAFSASNLPSGVTAAFSPASTTGTNSIVAFTASATAALISSAVMITGTSGGVTRTTSINLTIQPPLNDFSLSAASATMTQGGTTTSAVTVTPLGAFMGSVALSVNGVPGGVTATFAPSPTTGASILTFTATATAALGNANITITGSGGGITHTISINLTVNQASSVDFSLSASPAMLTINRGASGTEAVTVTPIGGFSGSVTLSASTPSGVTATFSPTSTTGVSTLTFAVSNATALGATNVIITGTSGSLSHSTTVVLTVSQISNPDFSLSASPAAVTINRGSSGASTIGVAPVGGFSGSVALSVGPLPSGVTAAFIPAATTGASALTLTASSTAVTGNATVTVTGTSGTLIHTTAIMLSVIAPPPPDFSLTASPLAVSLCQGGTATTTITTTKAGGLSGDIAFSLSGLSVGLSVTFGPTSTSGTTLVTFSASNTAAIGTTTATITGTSGALTHGVALSITVLAAGACNNGVMVTPVINSNSPFFDDEGIKVSNTGGITAMTLIITVQNTGGLSFGGQYNTVGGQFTQSHSSTGTAIVYQFSLSPGQTLNPGTSWLFDAQIGASGTVHPTSGDAFTIGYTTGGATFTQTGHF